MFYLPALLPCDGLPVWLMAEDDLTQALVLWWPAGTAWVVHGSSPVEPGRQPDNHPDNHLDAA